MSTLALASVPTDVPPGSSSGSLGHGEECVAQPRALQLEGAELDSRVEQFPNGDTQLRVANLRRGREVDLQPPGVAIRALDTIDSCRARECCDRAFRMLPCNLETRASRRCSLTDDLGHRPFGYDVAAI